MKAWMIEAMPLLLTKLCKDDKLCLWGGRSLPTSISMPFCTYT